MDPDASDQQLMDIDRERPLARSHQHVGGERSIVGAAAGADEIARGRSGQRRVQIGEPDTDAGVRRLEHDDRIGDRPARDHIGRTVGARPGIGTKSDRAVRKPIAARTIGDPQIGRGEPQIGDAGAAFGVIADVGGDQRVAAELLGKAGVGDLPGDDADMALDAEAAPRRGDEIGVGDEIDPAQPVDVIIVDAPLQRPGIFPALEIGEDERGGVDPVRSEMEVVRKDLPVLIGDIAIDLEIGDEAPGGRIEPGDALRCRMDRHEDLLLADRRAALGDEPLDAVGAEGDAVGGKLVGDAGRRERPVERRRHRDVPPGDIGGDRARGKQPRLQLEIAEAALREIEQPSGLRNEGRRGERDAGICLALVERCGGVDVDRRLGHPRSGAGEQDPGHHAAQCTEAAVLRRQRDIHQRQSARGRRRKPLPMMPVALPAHRQRQRACRAWHSYRRRHARARQA